MTERHAVGLDVGGTKIAGGLVSLETGEVTARLVVPTRPEQGGEATLVRCDELLDRLFAEADRLGWSVEAIGVAVCELVDPDGNVTSGQTVAWEGLPVRARFTRRARTVVEADVRAHALAEARWGAGRDRRSFVFVSVGTGISSCLVLDGSPYPGAHGNALVLATTVPSVPCPTCGNIQWPSLEEVASGPAICDRYLRSVARHLTTEKVIEAAISGDEHAVEVIRTAGEALGAALGRVVDLLDPEMIVLGGGLGSVSGLYRQSLVEACRRHTWAPAGRSIPIVGSELGTDAGVKGAALAAASER